MRSAYPILLVLSALAIAPADAGPSQRVAAGAADHTAAAGEADVTGSVAPAAPRAIPDDPMQRTLDDYKRLYNVRSRRPATVYQLGR